MQRTPVVRFRTLVLVRHGHNRADALTALGKRQAIHTARRLAALRIASIHCSTMRRAGDTARILAQDIRPPSDGRTRVSRLPFSRAHVLRECLPTRPVGSGIRSPRISADKIRRGRKRADRAFDRFFRPPTRGDSCHLIVSHGNVIRYLVCRSLKLGGVPWWRLGTSHCGVTIIRIASTGEMVLDAYNDTGHLPARLRTSGAVREL
jgi:serine/threonine-protein phosphatase PGAM5